MPGALADAPEGVRLVASGPSLVHFSVEIPAPALRPLVNEASADSPAEGPVGLSLEGYDEQFVPGGFALPVRVVTVAVPPAGAVRLLADPIEARVLDGVQLAPVSRKIAGPTGPGLDAERRAREGTGTAGVARLLGVSWMRNQRVARIAITPADYDGLSRRLRVYGRIDVRVEVSPGPTAGRAAEDPDPFEGVYRDVLVNYEQGKSWRRTAGPEPGVGDIEGSRGQSGSSGVFAGRSWIKIAITTTGFYKVDFGQLRSFQPFASDTTIVLDSLRLFTWPGNPVLPEENYLRRLRLPRGVARHRRQRGRTVQSQQRRLLLLRARSQRLGGSLRSFAARHGLRQQSLRDAQLHIPHGEHGPESGARAVS